MLVLLLALTAFGDNIFRSEHRQDSAAADSTTRTHNATVSAQPTRETSTPPVPQAALPPWLGVQGFTDHPGARCDDDDQLELAEMTSQSAVVICRGFEYLYYRGSRLSDGASITLREVTPAAGGFDARNSNDGTGYAVRRSGLTITTGGQTFVEPVVDFWARGQMDGPRTAAAGVTLFAETKSGKVRCAISAASVVCERNSAEGFPQAPPSSAVGTRWNLASVDATGGFNWAEGNIGGDGNDAVLEYGERRTVNGWNIDADSNGTRFTNVASGHGMFVSIDDVFSF